MYVVAELKCVFITYYPTVRIFDQKYLNVSPCFLHQCDFVDWGPQLQDQRP